MAQSWLYQLWGNARAPHIRQLGISPAERVVTRKKLGGKWDLRAILVPQTSLPPFFAFQHTADQEMPHWVWNDIFFADIFITREHNRVWGIWNTILLFFSSFFNHPLFKYLQSQDLLHWFRPYLILADNFRNFPTYSTQTFFEQILLEANSLHWK